MRAYRLNVDQLELFFTVCGQLNLDTEAKRTILLEEMASMGLVDGVTQTKMSKEEYLQHMSEKFGTILNIQEKQDDSHT